MLIFREVEVPPFAHWTVRELYQLMRDRKIGISALSERAGVSDGTISRWRESLPRVDNIEAALNALGYAFRIEPMANGAREQAEQWFEERAAEKLRAYEARAQERAERRALMRRCRAIEREYRRRA